MHPIVNILVRTHDRPEYFKICYESIKAQSYPNYQLIVGSDIQPCPYYSLAIPLKQEMYLGNIPPGLYYAPWNRYLNQLQTVCVNGYVIMLDDDDKMSSPETLQKIVDNMDEDTLLIWKVKITNDWIVPSVSFGISIMACDISGIGYCYHSKYNPVDWGYFSQGDYKVAKQLEAKGLKIKWLDEVLTETIEGPHGNNFKL